VGGRLGHLKVKGAMFLRRLALISLITILASGCDGGGSCPFQRPSCCDNQLFGCGPFDMPQGCSCDDYLSRSFQGAALRSSAERKAPPSDSTEGTWRVSLRKVTPGCPQLSRQSQRTIIARERRRRVELKLLGYANLRGSRAARLVRARGQYRTLFPRCVADAQVKMSLIDPRSARVSAEIQVSCAQSALSCAATFEGVAQRLY
jgi:hypothetical protein